MLIVAGTVISAPSIAKSAPLSEQQFNLLMRQCAPSVDPTVLRSVAQVESHFDPLVLHNNTKHVSITFSSVAASARQAKLWISRGYSVDLGLMQINSGNLPALRMTVEETIDPCRSLEAGANLLSSIYAQGVSLANRQAALLIALSRYNTGHPFAGLLNGYVEQVLTAQNANKTASTPSYPVNSQYSDWDIWAIASNAQHDGATWLVGSPGAGDFLIGAGAQPVAGEPHALSSKSGTGPGM